MKKVSSHPAAISAESDLVKLTREFESLREQIKENDEEVEGHREDIRAAEANHDIAVKHYEAQLGRLRRQRRTLDAMFENVNELLRPLVQTNDNCCVQELRRLR